MEFRLVHVCLCCPLVGLHLLEEIGKFSVLVQVLLDLLVTLNELLMLRRRLWRLHHWHLGQQGHLWEVSG